MSGIQRYEVFVAAAYGGPYAATKPAEMGDYVLHSDHEAEVARLRAEADSLRKDAERYRWLRDSAPEEWDVTRWLDSETQEIHVQDYLDEAIDAAMGAKA